ncbi:MAG: chemotaxis protein CheW [Anaerolineales bacterium]|nr:chemotaxis protein CheW [Anaerolineales bacterium]
MKNQLVVFGLANEQYGVDIATVESIITLQTITRIPQAPQFVEGVTNLRGHILPVIDLRRRFGLPPAEPTKATRIVVVEIDGNTVGMVVDAVSEVLGVSEEAIEPLSPLVNTVDSAFINGIVKVGERLIILLDLRKTLTAQEALELLAMPVVA